MTLLVENQHPEKKVDREALEELVRACLDVCDIRENIQVGLTFVDDPAIHELNREHRGVDRATDVLSFPLLDFSEEYEEVDAEEEDDQGSWEEEDDPDVDPETGEVLLGDIVISLDTAERQAEEYGHSFQREVGYLTVHGMMHLLGYDHELDEDKALMRKMEEEALAKCGLTRAELPEEGKPSYRSGFVTLVGRSNVGKSTIINALVGEKVSIVSSKPQTTRTALRGILSRDGYQIVFVDTPGQHIPRTKLGEYMMKAAKTASQEVDTVVMVIDGSAPIGAGDRAVLESLRGNSGHVLCVINKMDLIPRTDLLGIIDKLKEYDFLEEIMPVSALTGEGLPELEKLLEVRLTEGPQFFPEDMYTDQTQREIMAETIREKALYLLRDEVPHGIAVEMTRIEPHKTDADMMDCYADIYVEKDSHKGIVIGKRGATLQKIGSMARKDIEEMMGCAINLQLYVKVREGWRDRLSNLRDLGYDSKELDS